MIQTDANVVVQTAAAEKSKGAAAAVQWFLLAVAVAIIIWKDVGLWATWRSTQESIRVVERGGDWTHETTDILNMGLYTPDSSGLEWPGGVPVLLLVTDSEGCAQCQDVVTRWLNAVADTAATHSGAVIVVDLGTKPQGCALCDEIRGRKLDVRGVRPVNREMFMVSTGIASVPTAFAVNQNRRLVAAVRGVPSDNALKITFERLLARGSLPPMMDFGPDYVPLRPR